MEGQMGHQALLKEPSDQRPWSNACWQNTARVWGHLTLAQRSIEPCATGTIHRGFGLQGIGPSYRGCIRPLALGLMELIELPERNWAHWVGSVGVHRTIHYNESHSHGWAVLVAEWQRGEGGAGRLSGLGSQAPLLCLPLVLFLLHKTCICVVHKHTYQKNKNKH